LYQKDKDKIKVCLQIKEIMESIHAEADKPERILGYVSTETTTLA
jgi:hypothetical protein